VGTNTQPLIIPQSQHSISVSSINPNALEVLDRIRQAGFDSYLVGGCVRDLLLDLHPKDFDVATNARPEQVRRLFRRARVIGRRFKLIHVRFGWEVIEVATFRASPSDASQQVAEESRGPLVDSRILSDNVYGSREEDARRRDFTVNALYYDARDGSVIDDMGGVADIQKRLLRIIGEPESRYREDPVRMLRAVRLSTKLGFEVEANTAEPISRLAPLLDHVPPARMFDEFLKLFHGGCALRTYQMLVRYGLFQHLCPLLTGGDTPGQACTLFEKVLVNTDARVSSDKPVIAAFLFAGLLWEPLQQRLRQGVAGEANRLQALQHAAIEVIGLQSQRITIPRRVVLAIRDIWEMQVSLERRNKKWVERVLEHRRFRAAYDFLLLRGETGEVTQELCDWWTRLQEVDERDRRAMIRSVPRAHVSKKQTRPRRRRQTQQVT